MRKKGFTGISALLLLIAAIVITLALSSYFIIISDDLIGKGTETKQQINRGYRFMQIVEVTGTDATDGDIEELIFDVKMFDEQGSVHLDDLVVSLGEPEYRSLLMYRQNGLIVNNRSGYETYSPQEFGTLTLGEFTLDFSVFAVLPNIPYNLPLDFDGDGLTDRIYTCDYDGPCPSSYGGTHLRIDLSSQSTDEYVALVNDSDGSLANLSVTDDYYSVTKAPISGGFGYVSFYGTPAVANRIGWGSEQVVVQVAPYELESDLDDDGLIDTLYVNRSSAIIDVSSESNSIVIPLGGLLNESPLTLNIDERITSLDGTHYGWLEASGTTSVDDQIDADVTFTLDPRNKGSGYFVAEYIKRGERPLDNRITPGDMVRIYVETYDPLVVDESFTISLLYKEAEVTSKGVFVGDTIPGKTFVQLFPKV